MKMQMFRVYIIIQTQTYYFLKKQEATKIILRYERQVAKESHKMISKII